MKRMIMMLGLMILSSSLFAQINSDTLRTGGIAVYLDRYGSLKVTKPGINKAAEQRQMDRISIWAGTSKTEVFDYNEDAEEVTKVINRKYRNSDFGLYTEYDNSYNNLPPDITVKQSVYGYTDDPYVFSRYVVVNDGSTVINLSLGLFGASKPNNTYDNNVLKFDEASGAVYSFAKDNAQFTAVGLVSGSPYSVRSMDWNDYTGPTGADVDAGDSIRYAMLTYENYDNNVEVLNGNGSCFLYNVGPGYLAPGDSIIFTVAIAYTTEESEISTIMGEAQDKFDALRSTFQINSDTLRTGGIAVYLDRYGSMKVTKPGATKALEQRQMDRISLWAGTAKNEVFDYNEDSEEITKVMKLKYQGSDFGLHTEYDNSYGNYPPDITVKQTVYGFSDDPYVFSKYVIRNDGSTVIDLAVGLFGASKPNNTYDNNVLKYDAASKSVYSFAKDNAQFTALGVVDRDPSSVRSMDWNDYTGPTGADVDAGDSIRYAMLNYNSFDTNVEVLNSNGSCFAYNVGTHSLEPGESFSFTVAVAYTTEESEVSTILADAKAKYALMTGVKENSTLANSISLNQNYPNPFNPATTIQFELNQPGFVSLKVFNLLGQEVATLINGNLPAQNHIVRFDGSNLSSGMYLYRLQVGSFSQTKSMILIK